MFWKSGVYFELRSAPIIGCKIVSAHEREQQLVSVEHRGKEKKRKRKLKIDKR